MFDNLVMNGAIFLASIILVENIIRPLLSMVEEFFLQNVGVSRFACDISDHIGLLVYYCLWLLPLYLICLVMNGIHVAEIAERSFQLISLSSSSTGSAQSKHSLSADRNALSAPEGSPASSSSKISSHKASSSTTSVPIGQFLADAFYDTLVVMTCFGIVIFVDILTATSPWVCHMIADLCAFLGSPSVESLFRNQLSIILPAIGTCISFLYMCWLYSFWSFNARWKFQGIGIVERLRRIETDWAYFLGFGAPLAAATFSNTFFINAGVYSLAFPWLIILATCADNKHSRRSTSSRLHIFHLSRLVFEKLRSRVLPSGGKR